MLRVGGVVRVKTDFSPPTRRGTVRHCICKLCINGKVFCVKTDSLPTTGLFLYREVRIRSVLSVKTDFINHSYATNLRDASVPTEYISTMMGPTMTAGSTTTLNYLSRYSMTTMIAYNSRYLKACSNN